MIKNKWHRLCNRDGMHNFKKQILGGTMAIALAATAQAEVVFQTSTGVQGSNNNILTVNSGSGSYKVDSNWKVAGYYDSYGLTRGDVFGSNISNANALLNTGLISSPTATRTFGYDAYVNTGGNRPGWYNPNDGTQWIGASLNENNGGTPMDAPGNYVFQLDLSQYIDPNSGLVTVNIAGINADNHYEIAIDGSVAEESFLAKAFDTQETWNRPGDAFSFSFSPKDGTMLDVIVANSNDQLRNGAYYYDKNPAGFMIDGLTVSQASGPTPAQDKLTSTKAIGYSVTSGTGPVYQQRLVSAPEPGTWLILAAFVLITVSQARNKKALKPAVQRIS